MEISQYYNTADDYLGDLPSGVTYGRGPFREVRILVDDQVAGVAFPYATIFTGGVIPTAWRPIAAYGALDLPTYFIDLTPFVPLLADGNLHNISIDVVSAEANHTINDNWFVSGNLQVVTDSSSEPTTGNITTYSVDPYAVTTTTGSVGDNGDVSVTVKATRRIQIESTIRSGSGKSNKVVWSQDLTYQNVQNYLENTTVQVRTGVLTVCIYLFLILCASRMSLRLHLAVSCQHITASRPLEIYSHTHSISTTPT